MFSNHNLLLPDHNLLLLNNNLLLPNHNLLLPNHNLLLPNHNFLLPNNNLMLPDHNLLLPNQNILLVVTQSHRWQGAHTVAYIALILRPGNKFSSRALDKKVWMGRFMVYANQNWFTARFVSYTTNTKKDMVNSVAELFVLEVYGVGMIYRKVSGIQ